jgi:hypothetical protein
VQENEQVRLRGVVEEKEGATRELEKKLGECAETLKSNKVTIENLNKSIAEA